MTGHAYRKLARPAQATPRGAGPRHRPGSVASVRKGNGMTPEDEVLAVFARWHHEVEQLAVWSGGEARLHDLLRTAVGIRAEQARHGVAVMDFPWESLVDRVAQWHYDHPLGTAEYSPADVHDAVSAAVKSTRVEPLEDGVRRGAFMVRRTGGGFRLRYPWDQGPGKVA